MKPSRKKWWLISSLIFKLNTLSIKQGFVSCLILFGLCSNAQTFQNLVPNGSFESYTNCPFIDGQINFATPWNGPINNSSDYFCACSSTMNVPYYYGTTSPYLAYLNAKHGTAYAGIYSYQVGNYREYLECKLSDSLVIGNCYYAEFYAASAQFLKYRTNNISASFSSNSQISSSTTPIGLPQYITNYGNIALKDTVKWEKISGIYQAITNDKYIVLGNFMNDDNTDTINNYVPGQTQYYTFSAGYVLIDAVSVFSINPTGNLPWKYRDTTIVEGDSVYIGNTMGGSFNPQWFTIGGSYIATNAGIYVKPATTTSYVVNYTVCGTPRADTVEVKVVSDIGIREKLLKELEFKVFPNPANNFVTLVSKTPTEYLTIKVTDVNGRMLINKKVQTSNYKTNLDLDLFNGIYFVTIINFANEKQTKKLVIAK